MADPSASTDAQIRGQWFDESARAGANLIRVGVTWKKIASRQPEDPANPADPAYSGFETIDARVREAEARGQEVLLLVAQAPIWAVRQDGPDEAKEDGSWKPDPGAFGGFAKALARRYSGSFVVDGQALPRVEYFQAWSEPNLVSHLAPQWTSGEPKLVSGDHYRAMLNAFYDGVKHQSPNASVLTGGTAPFGDPPGGIRTRPLAFWREVFCLKQGKRKGKQLRAKNCPNPPKFDILAHNPISLATGPRRSARHRDDVIIPDVKNLRRTLRAAEKAGNTGTPGRHPIWATEVFWESDPPDGVSGVPLQKHARWLEESMYLLWRQGVRAFVWFQLMDQPKNTPPGAPPDYEGFQTGLLTLDGAEKPAFQAFRFPFVVDRKSRKNAAVWTVAPDSGNLAVQVRRGSGWRTVETLAVEDGVPAMTSVSLKGKAKVRGQLAGESTIPYKVGR